MVKRVYNITIYESYAKGADKDILDCETPPMRTIGNMIVGADGIEELITKIRAFKNVLEPEERR